MKIMLVARRKIIPLVPMDINREYSIFGTKYFPHHSSSLSRYLSDKSAQNFARWRIARTLEWKSCWLHAEKLSPLCPWTWIHDPSILLNYQYLYCRRTYLEICSMKVHGLLKRKSLLFYVLCFIYHVFFHIFYFPFCSFFYLGFFIFFRKYFPNLFLVIILFHLF